MATILSNLYLFPKDHKPLKPDGQPKTRPVWGTSETVNQELNEWVSTPVESALNGQEMKEVISTEEMLGWIDKMNKEWEETNFNPEREEVFVGSLDTEALYPSLDATLVAKLCGDLVAKKQLKIENVDYLWASMYLACTMTPEQVTRENMHDCVPDRRYKSGPKLKVGSMRKKNSHEKWVWREDPAKFTYDQKQRILARVVQTLIETTFNTRVQMGWESLQTAKGWSNRDEGQWVPN